MEHAFTKEIYEVLEKNFKGKSKEIFLNSELIQYINKKTVSATKGSKSRSSFANLYAIYVLVEDYINKEYHSKNKGKYTDYEGAEFSKLFKRQRELPFGQRLQNHALNNRMVSEYRKFFPETKYDPILRDMETNRYWINENLLQVTIGRDSYNIAKSIIQIIDKYVETKKGAFDDFINNCLSLQKIEKADLPKVQGFIKDLLKPEVDARLFEIVSYSILRSFYKDQKIFWGFEITKLNKENLKLYKTGRTNANDGGIDFVMKPLGRFFQVTETLDVKKYFLDIDKIERYPITFVIKSNLTPDDIRGILKKGAEQLYSIKTVVDKYMESIEEIINIPMLLKYFDDCIKKGYTGEILDEIIRQSKVEYNYAESEAEEEEE